MLIYKSRSLKKLNSISLFVVELVNKLDIADTQELIETSNIMKQKVVYLAGFLAFKFSDSELALEETIPCNFISELNRGGLHVPTLSTVFFVHSAMNIHDKIDASRQKCARYIRKLLSMIDSPMAKNEVKILFFLCFNGPGGPNFQIFVFFWFIIVLQSFFYTKKI